MGGGCIGTLLIGACLIIPVAVKEGIDRVKSKRALEKAQIDAKIEAQKKEEERAKRVSDEAEKMMQLWGGTLETANHEEKALFLTSYYLIRQRENNKKQSIINNNIVCAEFMIASVAILENHTHCKLLSKLKQILNNYFNISGNSLEMVSKRLEFYHRVYSEGIEHLIKEVLLVIRSDMNQGMLVEYDEYSPLVLIEFEEMMYQEVEGRATMMALVDLMNSEYGEHIEIHERSQ